jgi:hypothetical protein
VSADGRYFRHAPLPGDGSTRVFAAIATSLLDELLAPPDAPPAVGVDVHVTVSPDAGASRAPAPVAVVAQPPPVVAMPPALAPVVVQAAAPFELPRHRTILEIGPMLTPVSGGVEVELSTVIAAPWRIGVAGTASAMWASGTWSSPISVRNNYWGLSALYGVAFEIRRDGRRYDFGALVGQLASDHQLEMDDATVWFGAGRLAYRLTSNVSATFALGVALASYYGNIRTAPIAFTSLRWELPL